MQVATPVSSFLFPEGNSDAKYPLSPTPSSQFHMVKIRGWFYAHTNLTLFTHLELGPMPGFEYNKGSERRSHLERDSFVNTDTLNILLVCGDFAKWVLSSIGQIYEDKTSIGQLALDLREKIWKDLGFDGNRSIVRCSIDIGTVLYLSRFPNGFDSGRIRAFSGTTFGQDTTLFLSRTLSFLEHNSKIIGSI
ncbi:hypothetical protein CR513_54835, partial [Mucuna pruriens]